MTLYASLDLLLIEEFPLTIGIDAPEDVWPECIPGFASGPYRIISPLFLRWMGDVVIGMNRKFAATVAAMPSTATEADKAKPFRIIESENFYKLCLDAATARGITPDKYPASPGYSRPTIKSCVMYRGTFDLWDNSQIESFVWRRLSEDLPAELRREPVQISDFQVRCGHVFPLVRGPGLLPQSVRNTHIPANATEYHHGNQTWHEIPEHCKNPDAEPLLPRPAPATEAAAEETAVLLF